MRYLPKPKDPNGANLGVQLALTECASSIDDAQEKTRVMGMCQALVSMESEYNAKAQLADLHLFQSAAPINGVSKSTMKELYSYRMVHAKLPGRAIYGLIMRGDGIKRCPLCNAEIARTIDHFLPQKHYPNTTIMPINLVPACYHCQGKKLSKRPTCRQDQLIHPYFDNIDHIPWLSARVIQSGLSKFEFFVDMSVVSATDINLAHRINNHFTKLHLAALYSDHAALAMSDNAKAFSDLYSSNGPTAIKAHLDREALSLKASHNNSWKAVMYQAASSDHWFLNGGFRI